MEAKDIKFEEVASDIYVDLLKVQVALKAPKGQYNSFGKYSYRSCEDILEAVKPHLEDAGLTLVVDDEPFAVSGRTYIRATASLKKAGQTVTAHGYAREPESKKGMDESQITGMASSYARKYALNGLFLIDDTKDADSMDNTGEGKAEPKPKKDPKPANETPQHVLSVAAKRYAAFYGIDVQDAAAIAREQPTYVQGDPDALIATAKRMDASVERGEPL